MNAERNDAILTTDFPDNRCFAFLANHYRSSVQHLPLNDYLRVEASNARYRHAEWTHSRRPVISVERGRPPGVARKWTLAMDRAI